MSRVIVVTSGKGGVGKTTLTANIGIALSGFGHSVVMIDSDIGLNNLDVVMGVENKVVYDFVDCIEGKCRVTQALIQNPILENLFVLPSCRNVDKNRIEQADFARVVNALKEKFEYVLIDCPAGIGKGFSLAVSCATEAIVVVTPHLSAVRDADRVVSLLHANGVESINIVVNRIRGDLVARKEMLSTSDIESLMRVNLIGIIPESDEIGLYNSFLSFADGRVHNYVGVAFSTLAKNILNEESEKFDYLSKYKGFWGTIRRTLKRRVG